VSYKIPEEVFRGNYSKLEWRIGTSEARSVLPIWFLCWNYQNRQYYRAWVGKTAKGSLARPREVTGLTGGRHRSDRWLPTATRGPTVKRFYLLPSFFSLFTHSPGPLPPQNCERPPSLSYSTSLSPPWISKDSTMEKVQDWMEITLLRILHRFPFEFFGFPSSSSLSRYSKLCFARSPYMVQRFKFPLVEHLLRSPRSYTYRSIRFLWTHCENPRFGVGWPSPVWPVACVQSQILFSSCFLTHIYIRLSHVYLDQILDSKLHRLNVGAIGSVLGGIGLTGAPH
jgi:hypothetical protein